MVCLQEDSRGSVFKCRKQGHRAKDCRSNILGNGNNRTYTRTCCYCKEKGHIAANCPKKAAGAPFNAVDQDASLPKALMVTYASEEDMQKVEKELMPQKQRQG